MIRSARRRRSRIGFTLLELILTLAVLVALSAVFWPDLLSFRDRQQLPHAVDDLKGLLAGLRVRAMDEGVSYTFSFQPGSSQYQIGRSGDATFVETPIADEKAGRRAIFDSGEVAGLFALPKGITLRALGLGSGDLPMGGAADSGAASVSIEFRPDGTSGDAQFELADDTGSAFRLVILGSMGTIESAPVVADPTSAPLPGGTP